MDWKNCLVLLVYSVVLGLIALSFWMCGGPKSVESLKNEELSILPSAPKVFAKDTVLVKKHSKTDAVIMVSDYQARMAHVDSMYEKMYDLSERYREETALLVDRTSGWMGFWIAIIIWLAGIGAYFQYVTNKEELKRVEDASKRHVAELENMLKETKWKLDRSEKVSKISAIAHSIMDLPDVSFVTDTDAKLLMKKHMAILREQFVLFVDALTDSNVKMDDEIKNQCFIILSLLRDCVRKSTIIISDIGLSIRIQKCIDCLTSDIEKIAGGEITKDTILKTMKDQKKEIYNLCSKMEHLA